MPVAAFIALAIRPMPDHNAADLDPWKHSLDVLQRSRHAMGTLRPHADGRTPSVIGSAFDKPMDNLSKVAGSR